MPSSLDRQRPDLALRPCRLCNSSNTNQFSRADRKYLRCADCEAITLDASLEEYEALHPTYDPGPLADLADEKALRQYLGVEDKVAFLRPLIADVPQPRRLLDVGCGAGGYLLAARELGSEAVGLEPSSEHSTIGRRLGLSIRQDYFTPDLFPAASFDVVLLSHVIEHIYEPRAFIEDLFKVLRPGGKLVIVTPNAQSLVARLSGKWWVMLKPLDHVSMLSESSLRAMHLDSLGPVTFTQSEHPWEVAASLAAAGRDAALSWLGNDGKRLGQNQPTSDGYSASESRVPKSASRIRWDAGRGRARNLLKLASLPLHKLAVAQNRQACLIMTLACPK